MAFTLAICIAKVFAENDYIKKEESPLKNKERFSIGMEKIKEMYKFPLWKSKEKEAEKKEIWPNRRSIIWRTAVFTLCIWGGYELAILWHSNFLESFPVRLGWLVEFIGGGIGAAVCLLFIVLPMNRRRKKWKH